MEGTILVHAYVHARAPPLAAAAAAGRPAPVPVPEPGLGLGPGPGPGPGSGSGSGLGLGLGLGLGSGFLYLAWFFLNQVSRSTPAEEFESSANGCVSARTDPTVRQPLSENRPGGWSVATVLSEPSQPQEIGGREYPSGEFFLRNTNPRILSLL